MEIPTAPTPSSPTSISPHTQHLTSFPTQSLSPTPMSPHPLSLTTLSGQSATATVLNNATITLLQSSPPPSSQSNLLLLSSSSTLSNASPTTSVTSNINQAQMPLLTSNHNDLLENQQIYSQPHSPLGHHTGISTSHHNSISSISTLSPRPMIDSTLDRPSVRGSISSHRADNSTYPTNGTNLNSTAHVISGTPAVFSKSLGSPAYW